jgi:hypothetical protein
MLRISKRYNGSYRRETDEIEIILSDEGRDHGKICVSLEEAAKLRRALELLVEPGAPSAEFMIETIEVR